MKPYDLFIYAFSRNVFYLVFWASLGNQRQDVFSVLSVWAISDFVVKSSHLGLLIDPKSDPSMSKVVQQLGFVGLDRKSVV